MCTQPVKMHLRSGTVYGESRTVKVEMIKHNVNQRDVVHQGVVYDIRRTISKANSTCNLFLFTLYILGMFAIVLMTVIAQMPNAELYFTRCLQNVQRIQNLRL